MIQSFEDIKENPKQIIKNTYQFLDVDSVFLPPAEMYEKKINAYTKKKFTMPSNVQNYLQEICHGSLDELSKTHPDITKKWFNF